MDRRERKLRRKEYYDNPINHWVSVYKGVLAALLTMKLGELIYEFISTHWQYIQACC